MMAEPLTTLTEKEKETLRLILRGYDAKSMAKYLDLSVHTVNERLRNARRKLSVSSSREAARLLAQEEVASLNSLVHKTLWDAPTDAAADTSSPSSDRRSGDHKTGPRKGPLIGGLFGMSLVIALLALIPNEFAEHDAEPQTAIFATEDAAMEAAARDWLALVDEADWSASFTAAGRSLRDLNTIAGWQAASEQARIPLGKLAERRAVEFQHINGSPNGYRIARFRADFANRSGAMETVTLELEGDGWKVVGYVID